MSNTQSYTSPDAPHAWAKETPALLISVIVPIRNEERFIGRTLAGLMQQDYPSAAFEVIAVDGNSTDRTRKTVQAYVERYPNVHLRSNPNRWSSAARNIGVDAAVGEVVIIVDGHCQFVDDQYLRNVESAFRRSWIDCLGRPQPLDVADGSPLQHAIAIARSSALGHHPDSFIYSEREQTVPATSVAVAYRRSVFDKVGKFDENFDACEDVEFNHRVDKAGLHCLLAPSLRLRYYPRTSLSGLFQQMSRYGQGRIRLLRKHADTFSLKSLLPAAFVFSLIVGGVISALIPGARLPYLSVVGLYAAIISCFSMGVSIRERNIRLLWHLPLIFMSIHLGAGYGSLKELVLSQPSGDSRDR